MHHLVLSPPDYRDHSLRRRGGARGEEDHVTCEYEAADWEDGEYDGDNGVELLVLLSLVHINVQHIWRRPEGENNISEA